MSHTEHHRLAGARAIPVHVVIVSSTRTPETDTSGPILQAELEAAGHQVIAREILPDDVGQIRARIRSLYGGEARAVIFAGGTGISLKDGTFEAVSSLLDKEIPGFGEIFRALSFQEIGAAAMLSRATAGLSGDLAVFAIPGSRGACRLAARALIGPELAHVVREVEKEAPPPRVEAAPPPGDIPEVEAELLAAPSNPAPARGDAPSDAAPAIAAEVEAIPAPLPPAPEAPMARAGWLARLHDLGGRLIRGERIPVPEPIASTAAARAVLDSAGEVAVVEVAQGRYLALGYPDLRRARSRVLLIGPGSPWGEVVALHRHAEAGVVRAEAGGLLAGGGLGERVKDLTGAPYPGDGRLLAIDGGKILALGLDGRAYSWDGRRRRDEGEPAAALTSLLLRWSQR